MTNIKLNIYKLVLDEACEEFNGTEEYIKKRTEALYNEKKFLAEKATHFFTNNYKFC